jgi:hypothetical protein
VTGAWRLRLLDATCTLLRVRDVPRGRGRWFQITLRLLEARYRAAEDIGGRDFARPYDYVPF